MARLRGRIDACRRFDGFRHRQPHPAGRPARRRLLEHPWDVSGDGSTIVGSGSSASGYEAFRHTAGGGMVRLWDVLLAQGDDPAASGWDVLRGAEGVSLDGNATVGHGIRNGDPEAFVAVLLEPAGLAVLGLGGTALLRRVRGRARPGAAACVNAAISSGTDEGRRPRTGQPPR